MFFNRIKDILTNFSKYVMYSHIKRVMPVTVGIVLFASISVSAQDLDTTKATSLLGGELSHNGGYGGPELKFYPGAGVGGLFWMGGRGGWIINRSFSIGGAGYGLVSGADRFPVNCATHPEQKEGKLDAGYGGFYFEYINSSNELVHFTANLLVGFGGVTYHHPNFHLDDDIGNPLINEWSNHPDSWILVLEPGIAVDLNVAELFRISAGVGYRFVPNLDLSYKDANGAIQKIVEDDVFNGVSVNLTFKFGKF